MKHTSMQDCCLQVFYTEFHIDRTISVGTMDINSFTPVSKVGLWVSPAPLFRLLTIAQRKYVEISSEVLQCNDGTSKKVSSILEAI